MNNSTDEIKKKVCTDCQVELDANTENFARAKRGKYGLEAVCKPCRKKWRDKRKHIKHEYDKQYNAKNRDKIIEQSRHRYETKKEEMLEYFRSRYNDPDFVQSRREYRKTRKERDKHLYNEWRRNNTKRISTNKQRRYNRKRKLESTLTHEQWINITKAFDECCAYCGNKEELAREHFIPVVKGGEFTKNNIIPSCRSCNSSKNDKSFFEWYPTYEHYSRQREEKILKHLGYKNNMQQLTLI